MRVKLNSLLADYNLAASQEVAEQTALAKVKQRVDIISQSQAVLQTIAQGIQNQAHSRIARIATRCLKSIFGPESYELKVEFEQKRGKTEANLVLVRDGIEMEPVESAGGGVIDVLSFALRIAALVLARPSLRRVLVLDEPFKHVSSQYRPGVRALIETLAEEMEIQFILVTHSQELMIGNIVEIAP